MTYEQAREELGASIEALKPQDDRHEVLNKALQALDDCLEMGLTGDN